MPRRISLTTLYSSTTLDVSPPWSSDGDGDSGDREDAADEDELGSKRDGDDLLTDGDHKVAGGGDVNVDDDDGMTSPHCTVSM